MKATIVGVQRHDYPKKDGTKADAHTFHLSYNDANVVGQCTEQVYLSAQQLKNMKCAVYEDDYESYIGQDVEIDYNSRGFVRNFCFAE